MTLRALVSHFPDGRFDCHPLRPTPWMLRFRLGGDHPNGTAQRVIQAASRAGALFRDLFPAGSTLCVAVESWGVPGEPDDLLVEAFGILPEAQPLPACVCCDQASQLQIFEWEWHERAVNKALLAIANTEQGYLPRLSAPLWFFDLSRHTAFHMYDDRGCYAFLPGIDEHKAFRDRHRIWLTRPQTDPGSWSVPSSCPS